MKNKILKYIFMLTLVILLIINFNTNILGNKNTVFKDVVGIGDKTFENFQLDSEYLVLSKIYNDKNQIKKTKYGLMSIIKRIDNLEEQLKSEKSNKELGIIEYTSQVGLQGHIFSILFNIIHIPLWALRILCTTILAIILVIICCLLAKKYNKTLGAVFYFTFLLSPWVVAFARNLYWLEFLWFLPILLGLILSIKQDKKDILFPSMFAAVYIKCLCGYEYVTTIIIAAISFIFIDFILEKDSQKKKQLLKTTIKAATLCILAVITAIITHAVLKGNRKYFCRGTRDL